MNKAIKTVAVLLAGLTLTAGKAVAAPRYGRGHRPHCPPPIHHGWHGGYYHHHYHGWCWGRDGRYFWPGFVGGVVGGVVGTTLARPYYSETVVVQPASTVVSQPVVVQQPVVQRQPVWVEGRYVDQVQANGSTVRVWQPGHYE